MDDKTLESYYYCDFETSRALKEAGFNLYCNKSFEYALKSKKDRQDGYSGSFGWRKGELNIQAGFNNNTYFKQFQSKYWYHCSAPSISLALFWIEDVYGIYIYVKRVGNKYMGYYQEASNMEKSFNTICDTKNLAYFHTIKNVINNKYITEIDYKVV